eukprot:9852916-Alexandrium_andersonii.AAC.1
MDSTESEPRWSPSRRPPHDLRGGQLGPRRGRCPGGGHRPSTRTRADCSWTGTCPCPPAECA